MQSKILTMADVFKKAKKENVSVKEVKNRFNDIYTQTINGWKITYLSLIAFLLSFQIQATPTEDLLNLLSLYGTQQVYVLPAFNNYYQDINEGGGYSYLGQLSLVDDVAFFLPANVMQVDTSDYEFEWSINSVLLTNRANPQIYNFEALKCDGVVEMNLRITDKVSRAVFERTQWAYLGYNYIADCDCDDCPSFLDVFYEFYPDVSDYYFQVEYSDFDYNEDNFFDTQDILVLLTTF